MVPIRKSYRRELKYRHLQVCGNGLSPCCSSDGLKLIAPFRRNILILILRFLPPDPACIDDNFRVNIILLLGVVIINRNATYGVATNQTNNFMISYTSRHALWHLTYLPQSNGMGQPCHQEHEPHLLDVVNRRFKANSLFGSLQSHQYPQRQAVMNCC